MEEQYSNTRITNEYVYNTITNIDRENKICNDCGGAYPKYASINNGVVLCLSCTEKHRSLTNKVSFLRSLNDVWDDYLLLYLIRGGNSRFKLLMSKYRIQDDSAIEYKYKTKAAEYNRKSLRSEVLALEPPEELDVEIGNEISNECLNLYPEFEDMYVNSELENLSENADHEHCLSLSNKIKNTSKYLGESIGYLGHTIGNQLYHYSGRVKGKITSLNENYPVKILFNKTFKVLKIAGRYVIETSTPLIDSTCSYLKGNSNLDKEEV